VAVELGVDMQGLEDALSLPELKAKIMADIREANSFGIDGHQRSSLTESYLTVLYHWKISAL